MVRELLNRRPERFTRYDFFISYKREDAANYAATLEKKLRSLRYTCFLDTLKIRQDTPLIPTLDRALKNSRCLVLIGTEHAFKSTWVAYEVASFLREPGKAIVAINIDEAVSRNPLEGVFGQLEGLAFENETNENLLKGRPSRSVLQRLDASISFTKRNTKLRRLFFFIMAVFLALVLTNYMLVWYTVSLKRRINELETASRQVTLEVVQTHTSIANQ